MTPTAAIHVGKAQLGLDDDTYRDLLQLVTGKRSAGDMTPAERALDTGIRAFKVGRFYQARKNARTRRQAVAEFGQGFVNRMRHRLLDIFGPQIDRQAIAAADRALAEIYPDTKTIKPTTATLEFVQARSEGWLAAGDVHLSHGASGGVAPKLIGDAT